jgi:hypothetical protein
MPLKRLTRLRFFAKEEASLTELKHPTARRQLKASATLAGVSAEGHSASPCLGVDPSSEDAAVSETLRKLSAQLRGA